jgi:hypothetical protein
MTRLLLLCSMLVPLAAPAQSGQAAGAEEQSRQTVDYESFCGQDRAGKEALLAGMSGQARAALARTQLERWLEANTPRLTPQQIAAVKDRIRTIKPLEYSGMIIEQDMARAKAFETPTVLFSRDQFTEMGLAGPCLPQTRTKTR